jgi:hypothetical protein
MGKILVQGDSLKNRELLTRKYQVVSSTVQEQNHGDAT